MYRDATSRNNTPCRLHYIHRRVGWVGWLPSLRHFGFTGTAVVTTRGCRTWLGIGTCRCCFMWITLWHQSSQGRLDVWLVRKMLHSTQYSICITASVQVSIRNVLYMQLAFESEVRFQMKVSALVNVVVNSVNILFSNEHGKRCTFSDIKKSTSLSTSQLARSTSWSTRHRRFRDSLLCIVLCKIFDNKFF